MKTWSSYAVFFLFAIQSGFAQDFREQFNGFLRDKDTVNQLKTIVAWEKKKKDDPELYVARFNYYFSSAPREVLQLGSNPEGKEALSIQDSTGKTVSYLYPADISYDPKKVSQALHVIDQAISKFPTRLDMRFGKIYVLGEVRMWQPFTDEIVQTVHYSAKIQQKWTWTNAKPLEDARQFMISSIQGYVNQLYETNDDALLSNMQAISEAILEHYPDDVMNLSNLSIIKMIRKDFEGALVHLLKAEKLDPNDTVVLGNIANAYAETNQKDKAIKYYERMVEIGNEETKAFARTRLEKLKN